MKKKQYIIPACQIHTAPIKSYLAQYGLSGDGYNKTTDNSFTNGSAFSNERNNSFGSTYADEISTSGSIWDF